MIHVVCVRVGTKYSRDYVAILHDSVKRNLEDEHRFWCITDDPIPIHEEIGIIEPKPGLDGWWQKVSLFSPENPWESGDRIVYLDLDVAIVGRLEGLVKTKGIIRDWNLPGFNSSVMVWDAGEHGDIWTDFNDGVPLEMPGDQDWITAQAYKHCWKPNQEPEWEVFPRAWCLSYRGLKGDFPPASCKVVCYHGSPKPHECQDWTKEVWKIGGLTTMLTGEGMNTDMDHVLENVRINSARKDVTWFSGSTPHNDTMVLVGGAPSLKDHIKSIRDHMIRGSVVVALNNAGAFLNSHGITPNILMVCDARPENVVFVRAHAKRYLLASQCDPSLFDETAGKGKDTHIVQLWVCDEMRDILEPYDATEPICLIGGGSTVGLRAITIAVLSGFQKLHIYGMDSSFAEGQHHAYDQQLNDQDKAFEAHVPALNKNYWVAPWMARQAAEFRDIAWPMLDANNVKVWVHGKGLIPDMAKALKAGKLRMAAE